MKCEPYPSRSQEPSKSLPRGPKELPRGPQEGPESHQEGSKRAPRGLQSPPRGRQRGLGGSQEACARRQEAQEGSRVLQEGVREASEVPKRPVPGARRPSWLETPPKTSQGSSKTAPDCRGPKRSFRCRGRRALCIHSCFALHWVCTRSAIAVHSLSFALHSLCTHSALFALALHSLCFRSALAFIRSAFAPNSRWTRAALVLHLPSTRCETSLGHSHLLPIVCTRAAAALQSLYRSAFAMHWICIHFALAPYSLCALSAFALHSLSTRTFVIEGGIILGSYVKMLQHRLGDYSRAAGHAHHLLSTRRLGLFCTACIPQCSLK